jgi:hypothetical protein
MDRNLHPFFGQKLCGFSYRQAMFSPFVGFGSSSSINAMASGFALGNVFGKVHFFMAKQVSEQRLLGNRISKALSDHLSRQTIDEQSAQGLIAARPIMDGMEEGFLATHAHANLIASYRYSVNYKFLKILYKPILCLNRDYCLLAHQHHRSTQSGLFGAQSLHG